jgi:RimJ/RimL family protein N-acetyltransferase
MTRTLAELDYWSTERLLLRPFERGDVDSVLRITNDPAITDAISFFGYPFTRATAARLFVAGGRARDCFVGMWQRAGRALVGAVGAHLHEHDVEIGYWIGRQHWGQGYAGEGAGAVISVLLESYPGRQVYAECLPSNRASWRVLEKLGFMHVGPGERPGRERLELI